MMVTKGVPYAASLASTVYFERKGILDSKNEMTIFNNPEFGQIRTTVVDGEPWFVASDVCKCLKVGNPRQALSRLDDDEKGVILNDTPGGRQKLSAVNEPGLYTLALSSRKKEARTFKRWIAHDVVPAIRKTGGYIAGEENMTDEELLSRALLVAQKKIELRDARIAELEVEQEKLTAEVEEMKPESEFYRAAMDCKATMTTTDLAASLGIRSPQKLNKILCGLDIQHKDKTGSHYLLNAKYGDYGYAVQRQVPISPIRTANQLRWTQRGRKFVYDALVENGIIDADLFAAGQLPEEDGAAVPLLRAVN